MLANTDNWCVTWLIHACAGWLINALLVLGSRLRREKKYLRCSPLIVSLFLKYLWSIFAYLWNIRPTRNWHRKHDHNDYWNCKRLWWPVRYFSRLSIKPPVQLTSLWCTMQCTLHDAPYSSLSCTGSVLHCIFRIGTFCTLRFGSVHTFTAEGEVYIVQPIFSPLAGTYWF